jgi:hemerythrin superfamily protein
MQTHASPHATPTGRTASKRTKAPDAVRLLRQDHKEVDQMFEEYETLRSGHTKRVLIDKICLALEVHTQIEEEIFYPAVREALGEEDLLDEAKVEHDSAKDLIAQIRSGTPGDDLFDAKVKVLGEYIRHHVKEEQTELFPRVNKSSMDVAGLGARLLARKEELMAMAEAM